MTKGGEVIPVLLTLSLLKDDTGEPIAIATNAADISALKQVEQQLAGMSKVFRDGSDPILIENLDEIEIDLNREAERAYGWSREELIGEPIQTLVPPDRHQQASKLLHRCRSGEEVRNVEGLRVTKGGEVIPVLLTLSLLKDDTGEPIAIATNAADITALKQVEQQLAGMSKVFRDGSDPILIENLDGIVIDLNREAERAYGWSREELIGEPIQTLVPPDRHQQASKLLHRCRSGEEVRNVEGLRVTKGGEVIPVLLTLSLLKDDTGEPIAIATNAADITALKQVEKELSELSIKLSKYLSPQIYQSIFSGERDVTINTARKKLTVFFSDIKEFTATTEGHAAGRSDCVAESLFDRDVGDCVAIRRDHRQVYR